MKKNGTTTLFRSGWMILAVVLLVAVFLSLNWYYYWRTRNSLDEDFSFRLRALSSLVSLHLEREDVSFPDPLLGTRRESDEEAETEAGLRRICEQFSLSNILIIREDGVTLHTVRPDMYPPGDLYLHWNMDYEAIILALEGTASSTALYKAPDGMYLKAGYAPFPFDSAGAGSVVAVEASVDFLQGLSRLRGILTVATIVSSAGAILFIWFVLKATGSLIRARESLMRSETLSMMGRMAAGVAHEIRNPLFIIRSSAEKMKRHHPEDSSDIDTYILDEVDRLNDILHDYLLFARDEPAPKQKIDLVKTLNRSTRLVRDSLGEKKIQVTTAFDPDSAPFTGEEKRLQQAFLNILINAEQSIKSTGRIDVSFSTDGNRYTIRFEDNGFGIPEKDFGKVFEPFYTTKAAGSGLGLAIVKKVVEEHGGRIDIASAEATGTVVTVTLPIIPSTTGEGDELNTRSR